MPTPVFSHAEPVLPVRDIAETLSYWENTLGFPDRFVMGDPPFFGAISWQKKVFVQFVPDPEQLAVCKGISVWIRLRHIESLYALHQERKADIVSPLEQQPWGLAQYSVRELNGHLLHFAGGLEEKGKSEPFPSTVNIAARKPTVAEFGRLAAAVFGTGSQDEANVTGILAAAITGVVAEDGVTGEVVGSVLLLGDHVNFYYIKDLMVLPDWQGRGIGSALMLGLNRWLDEHGTGGALVGLFARETLEPFYQRFGFGQSFGMLRFIK